MKTEANCCEKPTKRILPRKITFFCPDCAEPISIRSATACAAIDAHTCRPAVQKTRKGFVVAAPPCPAFTRLLMERCEQNERDCNHIWREYTQLSGVHRRLTDRVGVLERERDEAQKKLQIAREELQALKSRRQTPVRDGGGAYNQLVHALQEVMKAPVRRRRFLALLHPDVLKRTSLCDRAKLIRDAVSLE